MDDEDSRTIWCGNLSENVSEKILYELFLQAGPLQSVRIPKTREGKQRAFGFVTYKHICSVPYALALFEGTELYKRELRLQSRNTERIKLDPWYSRDLEGYHNRSKSLPTRFGGTSGNETHSQMNFDALLSFSQNLRSGGSHVDNKKSLYSSQSGTSRYLGGANDLSTRSLQGGWSNRNHPYSRQSTISSHNSGGHRRHGDSRNHHKR